MVFTRHSNKRDRPVRTRTLTPWRQAHQGTCTGTGTDRHRRRHNYKGRATKGTKSGSRQARWCMDGVNRVGKQFLLVAFWPTRWDLLNQKEPWALVLPESLRKLLRCSCCLVTWSEEKTCDETSPSIELHRVCPDSIGPVSFAHGQSIITNRSFGCVTLHVSLFLQPRSDCTMPLNNTTVAPLQRVA